VRNTRPCLSGNLFCGHFGILDSLFDSIWSDTTANEAIDNIFSSQRPGRFPYLSYVSQHIFWNIRHSAPLSGFHPQCKSDGVLGSIAFGKLRAGYGTLNSACATRLDSEYTITPHEHDQGPRRLERSVAVERLERLEQMF
jgi:hypothetical protein